MTKSTSTGEDNTGNWNSGNWNSGNWNSGYRNSGYGNSGYRNSGDWNSGDWNSGNRNSGNRNSGYGNSTNRESGIFNSTVGTLRMFNRPTNLAWDDIDHPHFAEFYLTKWIPEADMTDDEKKADPNFFVREGYLKSFAYQEAWTSFWKDTDETNRQKFLNLPNFDPAVFKDITGVDVEVKEKPNTVEIGGKTYEVTQELKDALDNLKEI